MNMTKNDGGRAAAGYEGATGDCVVRSIAIATEKPYQEVYDALAELMKGEHLKRKRGSPRNGVARTTYEKYLKSLGWEWVPTMAIGSGCKVHLKAEELPKGRIIARLSKHLVAVVDGAIHDTYDPSRGGTRCVYGYFTLPDALKVVIPAPRNWKAANRKVLTAAQAAHALINEAYSDAITEKTNDALVAAMSALNKIVETVIVQEGV